MKTMAISDQIGYQSIQHPVEYFLAFKNITNKMTAINVTEPCTALIMSLMSYLNHHLANLYSCL